MLPTVLAEQLQIGLSEYIKTTFPMTNAPFRDSLDAITGASGSVCLEPYLSLRLPFRPASGAHDCSDLFAGVRPEYPPYAHQRRAFERLAGDSARSTIIATGTGSGKTECFLYPILDYCYRRSGEPGIKALIIYPMNALANDQAKRIAGLIHRNENLKGNVTVGMYVGGFDKKASTVMTENGVITDRATLRNAPPDILLTNFKMLDYLLMRPEDAQLWSDNRPNTLRFVAVDELHTFDGAQGTDLACLLRRLKARLWSPKSFLCYIGTSATLGSQEENERIREYASTIFGGDFEDDCIVTEDRLTPKEFFADSTATDFTLPTHESIPALESAILENDFERYLATAAQAWLTRDGEEEFDDVTTDEFRLELANRLMRHKVFQTLVEALASGYRQGSELVALIADAFPALEQAPNAPVALDALLALVSHARIGAPGKLRPFLNVQVQFWLRELRRFLGKVDGKRIEYSLAGDLNEEQARNYLPIVNCRDCGATGWATTVDEKGGASLGSLDAFYNLYFKVDEKIRMFFPSELEKAPEGMATARLCPKCLHVEDAPGVGETCDECGADTIKVFFAKEWKEPSETDVRGQYVCPFCGSKRGLGLIGLRSATAISVTLSQLFASRFNDDKKALTFSDSVQDAAHRAGFFNARTWRFGLRAAVQHFAQTHESARASLANFAAQFVDYWRAERSPEDFLGLFTPPNLTWRDAYQNMLRDRKIKQPGSKLVQDFIQDVSTRLRYEIALEYGLTCRIGRTLEKTLSSCLAFPRDAIEEIVARVAERARNEQAIKLPDERQAYAALAIGVLDLMRRNGAIWFPEFYKSFLENGCKTYLLSQNHLHWSPGVSGRSVPRFLQDRRSSRKQAFDRMVNGKYHAWLLACSGALFEDENALADILIEELLHSGLVQKLEFGYATVYALDPNRLAVTTNVARLKCPACGVEQFCAASNLEFWAGAPCPRCGDKSRLVVDEPVESNYYGRLFQRGSLERINAREHTGLLQRGAREELEKRFKASRDESRVWDPNVLSCTPTLEMGVDVGDLSSVVLCSVPPTQSQFLQRVGRAGRRDGNALALTVASARPHDLYFYAEPREMLEGEVRPPRVFLDAPAVLERQFVAFCLDSWVKDRRGANLIPKTTGEVLNKLTPYDPSVFPYNFLSYAQNNLSSLLNYFREQFQDDWNETTGPTLEKFAKGDGKSESPMAVRVFRAFDGLRQERDALIAHVQTLDGMIAELESKPKDASFDEEMCELQNEKRALLAARDGIVQKDVFNFLSDEGLVPNYAFPEPGVALRAVLYRKKETDAEIPVGQRQYDYSTYEYMRSASAAISEFAPNNSFYVDGRKLSIDQIDLTSAQSVKWRLCPNCSHAEMETASTPKGSCPKCGSPLWSDAGQVRNLLKPRMVYSNMKESESQITDEADDRAHVFYFKQFLVDVDEEKDVTSAFEMPNAEFNFGYEFARKATLREINFGESDVTGDKFSVSGIEAPRKGFRVCRGCGKIQTEGKEERHALFCKYRKSSLFRAKEKDKFDECLFLYREFESEALRMLIPATSMDATRVRTESFAAAVMLGLTEYFGNVDHLRAVISEAPAASADFRKQYLTIYDSVPGGTGFLKQLTQDENSLVAVFEKALDKLENCSCKEDPQKDGCYRCLYAYRQSAHIGSISRATAIRMLKALLSGKENRRSIKTIGDIPVNKLFESELEAQFIEALKRLASDERPVEVVPALINGKEGNTLKIKDALWEIEPQVTLDLADGVIPTSRPDFVMRPLSKGNWRPIAVFLDGFQFHCNSTDDDALKREGIRRSGRYRVWSFSWKDVQTAFKSQGDYQTETLAPTTAPGVKFYKTALSEEYASALNPAKSSNLELFARYLEEPNAEELFAAHARAHSYLPCDQTKMKNQDQFETWNEQVGKIVEQTRVGELSFAFGATIFGTRRPRVEGDITVYAGACKSDPAQSDKIITVCAVLNDDQATRSEDYQRDWNGFWRYVNLMQYHDRFVAVTTTGLATGIYWKLKSSYETPIAPPTNELDEAWREVEELVADETALAIVAACRELARSVPDVGLELTDGGRVVATLELAWSKERVGYMTQDQALDRERAEALGWKIVENVAEFEEASF
ncbi:MAG: DEAD/DEAH box helicase [Thermoguttaceae bacterium]|nr:DEAD/DEAH box helicase [Thermoguttaceae bacterium]